jgi:nicotinamidase-related amidase
VEVFEKTAFSSCGAAAFVKKLGDLKISQAVICGLETHVCVNQTAHDLLARGYQVHLLTDCVSSRAEQDKRVGLDKMMRSGALPSSTEMALFELMRDARHEQFKAIQKLIK